MNRKDIEMDKFKEITVDEQNIFKGKIIDVFLQTVELPNRKLAKREIVRHPGAVAILPLTKDNRLIVVEQFRKALERSIIEIPAGKLDPGEDPYQCAVRELKEETGCSSNSMEHVVSFYTSPGFANEIIHLYRAFDCDFGENKLDEDEFVELLTITLEEAKQLIREQRIIDAKTILAIYYWELIDNEPRSTAK